MSSDWPIKSITEIVDFNPSRKIQKGRIAPFIEMAALSTGAREVTEVGEREFTGSGSKFQNGDTLFARITPCLENGKTAKITVLNNGEVAHGSTEFIVIAAKDKRYDEDFVYYIARLPEFRSYAQSRMEGTSGRQRVPWQALATYELPIPPKEMRKKIGEILCSIDDKIQLNHQINQTLEQIAQALFKSWFVDFDPVKAKINAKKNNQDPELAACLAVRQAMRTISGKTDLSAGQAGEQLDTLSEEQRQQLTATAALFPDALEDSELGEIPRGWEVKTLDKKFIPEKGKNITKKTITPGIVPVVAGGLTPAYYHNTHNVTGPVVTISASGANAGFVNLYHQNIWASDCSYINSEITNYIYSAYLFLKSKQDEITKMQQGAAQPHVYPKDLVRLVLADAPDEIWEKFEKLVEPLFGYLKINIEEITSLSEMRDILLPKLLSGEITLVITPNP